MPSTKREPKGTLKNKYVLHIGIVGLGFIGPHHINAFRSVDSPRIEVDACAVGKNDFARKKAKAIESGFDPDRIYKSLEDMIKAEKGKLDLIFVATPNHLHKEQCTAIVKAGFHLGVDKPLARNLREADEILAAVEEAGVEAFVTPTYCRHAAVIEARHLIRVTQKIKPQALIGGIFKYLQGWLKKKQKNMTPEEGAKLAKWRRDRNLSGEGGATGDILSHLLFQLEDITGLRVVSVRANRRWAVEGKKSGFTDDEVIAQVTLENGAVITLMAVQYAGGHDNDNSFELWLKGGTTVGWDVVDGEVLRVCMKGGPVQHRTRAHFKSPLHGETNTMPGRHNDGWKDADGRHACSAARSILRWKTHVPFHTTVKTARNINAVCDAIIESSSGPFTNVAVDWRN